MKPTTPYGQIPLLEVDGEVISESVAIARYCAREFGLAGKTTFESAQADEIVDAVQGAIEKQYVAYLFEKVVIYFSSGFMFHFNPPPSLLAIVLQSFLSDHA